MVKKQNLIRAIKLYCQRCPRGRANRCNPGCPFFSIHIPTPSATAIRKKIAQDFKEKGVEFDEM